MKIINQSIEIIKEKDPAKKIEMIGRVSHKSEGKITDSSANKFVNKLRKLGHTSVLEHVWRIMHVNDYNCFVKYKSPSFINYIEKGVIYNNDIYINQRAYEMLTNDTSLPCKNKIYNDVLTVKFVTSRAIANELVRHRVASFCQESTRYVKYDNLIFIKPTWYRDNDMLTSNSAAFHASCMKTEALYSSFIDRGLKAQEARDILPLSLKTEIHMTSPLCYWFDITELDSLKGEKKSILAQRLHKNAHPQIRALMLLLVKKYFKGDKYDKLIKYYNM